MKTSLSQGSQIWPRRDVTSMIYITEKAAHQHAQNITLGIFDADWLFRLTTWFRIHLFLEVVVQQPLFSSLLLSYIPGGGPGSWLMHFPYVVLHGCFGKF